MGEVGSESELLQLCCNVGIRMDKTRLGVTPKGFQFHGSRVPIFPSFPPSFLPSLTCFAASSSTSSPPTNKASSRSRRAGRRAGGREGGNSSAANAHRQEDTSMS